jgi:hypothetical protein
MEKVVYLLWHGSGPVEPAWAERLLGPTCQALLALDPRGLTINVADATAAEANVPVPAPADDPSPVAEVSLWLDNHDDRGPYQDVLEALLDATGDHLAGYLVTESLATDYGRNPWSSPRDWADGERSRGVLMLTLMPKPDRMDDEAWYTHWYGTQSPMSTAIQPRTRYVRNAVARPLTPGAPPYRGIVEEAWPSANHVNDPDLFYCAEGDADVLAANLQTMLDSVTAFLDLDQIRLAAMSEHLIRNP